MGIFARAIKNLSRRKTRALLVIIALTLALTLLIILPPSINARQALTREEFGDLTENYGVLNSTIILSATEVQCNYPEPAFNPSMTSGLPNGTTIWLPPQQLMNDSLSKKIAAIPDVTNVIPILEIDGTKNLPYEIYGVPLDNASLTKIPSLLPANITEGRNLRAGDGGVVVLDELTEERLNVTLGGVVTISGLNLTVVGIEGSELPWNTHGATMSLADAQAVTNSTNQVSTYDVFVDSVDNVNTVVSRIRSVDSNIQVYDGLNQLNAAAPLQSRMDELVQGAQNNLNQIQNTGFVEVGLAIVADAAIILFIMMYNVRERTKEIGTFKAMGASNQTILSQFMLEAILLSVVSAVIAITVGDFMVTTLASALLPTPIQTGVYVGYNSNGTLILGRSSIGPKPILYGNGGNNIPVALTLQTMLFGIGAAVLLGVLGSLYPALKAARTRPAEAMRYE